MTEHEASRRLVKSAPELWAECSDAGSLARHLGQFGEISITKLEPETAVAWEGEHVRGTVRLEPSGWGTKVTLTAEGPEPEPVAEAEPEPVAEAEPEPVAVPPPGPPDPSPPVEAKRVGWFERLRVRWAGPPPRAAPPAPVPEPVAASEPEPVATTEPDPVADPGGVLTAALESLGQAHHRPFSRA